MAATSTTIKHLHAASWTFCATLCLLSCSSQKPAKDPDLAADAMTDNADTKTANKKVNAKKSPISDDGYDDDWNNIGSQQQATPNQSAANQNAKNQETVQNNAKNNVKNDTNALSNEPPLTNQPINQAVPANTQGFLQNDKPSNVPNNLGGNAAASNPVANAPIAAAPVPPVVNQAVMTATPAVAPPQPKAIKPVVVKQAVPPLAELRWVGYDFVEKQTNLRVKLMTRGAPRFEVLQEVNKAHQPELVVRFKNTKLRHKIRRDIDANEFRAPVAYIRMREDKSRQLVDVVMTLRDEVKPRLYAHQGHVMLTFPIPARYSGHASIGQAPVAKAQLLSRADIMPVLESNSDMPIGMERDKAVTKAIDPGVRDVGQNPFAGAPADGGAEVAPVATTSSSSEMQGGAAVPAATTNDGGLNFPSVEATDGASPAASVDDFNFGTSTNAGTNGGVNNATPANAPSSDAAPAKNNNSSDDGSDDDFDDDSLDDFDDGKGESTQSIDKFEVQRQLPASLMMASQVLHSFAIAAVGQDDFNQSDSADTEGSQDLGGEDDFDEQTSNGQNGTNQFNQGNGEANFNGANAAANTPTNLAPAANTIAPANTAITEAPANVPVEAAPVTTAPVNSPAPPAMAPVATNAAGNAFVEPAVAAEPAPLVQDQMGSEQEQPAQGSRGGRPMKLDFRGAPLNEVIRALGQESGVNFIYPPEIGQKQVFINLTGVPFNDALKALLEANALGVVEVSNNLVRIDSLDKIAQDRESQERRRKAELRLRPTKILVHRLSYAKAEDAQKMLADMLASASKEDNRISVQIDARSNSVIVNAPANDLATVKALLERIDLETPQVKIASRIIEVNKTFNDSFGISWGTPFNVDQGRGLGLGNLPFPNYMLSRYAVDADGTKANAGNFNFRFGSTNNSLALDLALSMEEQRGTTEILQSSNLLVEDNVEAEIIAGKSDFFRRNIVSSGTASPSNGPELDEVTYNLTMKVKPHITADGSVQMKLFIQSDSPTSPQATSPGAASAKSNRSITTSLLRRSGETAVIGGIYTTSKDQRARGVPYLSSIPIIGALFRSSSTTEDKRELLVMVTPTIVNGAKQTSASASEGESLNIATSAGFNDGGMSKVGNFNNNSGLNNTSDSTQSNLQNNSGQQNIGQQNGQQEVINEEE